MGSNSLNGDNPIRSAGAVDTIRGNSCSTVPKNMNIRYCASHTIRSAGAVAAIRGDARNDMSRHCLNKAYYTDFVLL